MQFYPGLVAENASLRNKLNWSRCQKLSFYICAGKKKYHLHVNGCSIQYYILYRISFSKKTGLTRKNDDYIAYPAKLRLRSENVSSIPNINFRLTRVKYIQMTSSSLFALRSFICHYGSTPDHGHYTAFVKIQSKWFETSDTSVRLLIIASAHIKHYKYLL